MKSKSTEQIFELDISVSFEGEINYRLCKRSDKYFLTVTTLSYGYSEPHSGEEREKIYLSPEQASETLKRYEAALNFGAKDEVMGCDGSTWCLKTKRGGSNIRTCFWTPEHETKQRGLTGLMKLGMYLFEISNIKEKGFELY